MPSKIAAVRVQNPWHARTGTVSCTARLTRPLTKDELARLKEHPEFRAIESAVSYTCRPEDVEETEQKLRELLREIHANGARPEPVGARSGEGS